MPQPSKARADFIELASAEHFTRFGFWKPKMCEVHAKVWDTLREMGLRYWSDVTREIRVHPDDFDQAQAVLRCVERQLLPSRASAR